MTLLEYDPSDSDSDDEFDSGNYSKSVYYKFLNVVKTMLNPKAEERPTAKTALKEFYKLLISNELEGFQIYGAKNIIIHINNLVIEATQSQKDSVPII